MGKICNETNNLNSVKTQVIKDYIKGKNVLDAGCGLGYLSLEMSKYADTVVSTDIDKKALNVLENNVILNKITNIITLDADFYNTQFQNIDYVVASFFSKPTEDINYMLSIAKCGVIVMLSTNMSKYELLNNKTYKNRQDAQIFCKYLDDNNIRYEKEDITEQNGQYLEDEIDAYMFLNAFSKIDEEEKQELIQKSRLEKEKIINKKVYKYFVSLMKKISIVIIEK